MILGLPYITQGQISAVFDSDKLKEFKKTKTVFFHRKDDDPELLEKILKEVWTLTEIEVASYRKMPAYLKEKGYSYFSINAKWYEYSNIPEYLYIDLKLWMHEGNDERVLSEISLDSDSTILNVFKENKDEPVEGLLHLYTDAKIGNWQPGFLKGYLKFINNQIIKNEEHEKYERVKNVEELNNLSKKTLYIPEYSLKDSEKSSIEKTFEDYHYKYQVLSDEELSNKIINDEQPFYYLSFVYLGAKGVLSIYNSKTHKMIYNRFSTTLSTGELLSRDTESISEQIEKSVKKMRKNKR